MTLVRSATSAEIPEVGRTLAAAFEDDPVWRWLVPPARGWQDRLAGFFAMECEHALARGGEVLVDDELRGAAIWAAPERWKGNLSQTARMVPRALPLFRGRLVRALRTEVITEKQHPHDPPHWYLAYLGARPGHQGKGIGSALISAVVDRCDEEGIPAYLESSKEANLALYHRKGFELTGQFGTAGGGPPIWTMWREPRPGGVA